MTPTSSFGEFPELAAQNAPLLKAIAQGPAASSAELCQRSGVLDTNLKRKLGSLLDYGLIVSTGEKTHQVAVTETATRALAAIAVFEGGAAPTGPQLIALDRIDPNPFQPRTDAHLDPDGDIELAQSIADKGVLQPLLVRLRPDEFIGGRRYEQAFGHRRLRAARLAVERGLVPPDFAIPATIRDLSDEDMEEIALVENVHQKTMHWMDEADAYLRLANRGKSAADIKRLVGEGARKKRSIQDLIKIARELAPEDKARTRLPDSDANRLSVDQCKFLVGERKPKPAFELSPKLAVAMAELLDAGEAEEGEREVIVRLHRKPVGGPLITLSDRGLLKFRFDGPSPMAVIDVGEDLAKWLEDLGFHDDREACLHKVRVAAMGELAAGAATGDGRYVTAELNPPEEREADLPPLEPGEPIEPPDDGDADIPPFLRRLAGAGDTPPPAEPTRLTVKPEHALAVIELAHKLERHGEVRPSGRAVPVSDDRRADPLANDLVFERLVMFMPMGAATLAALTPTACAWLEQQGVTIEDGVPRIADEVLQYKQAEAGHAPAGVYVTGWLNAAAPAEAPAPRPAPAPARAAPTVDDRHPAAVCLQRLAAAAREAELLIGKGLSRRLTAKDADPVLALLRGPLEEAGAVLAGMGMEPAPAETDQAEEADHVAQA